MSPTRIVIADDHPMVLRGICALMNSENDLEVVAACSDGSQAIKALRQWKPDVAVLDISMPGAHGLEVLECANSEGLTTKIIFLSAEVSSREIMAAMAEGAYGILLKDSSPHELLTCVRDVAKGSKHLPLELFERVRGSEILGDTTPAEKLLTKREWSVAALAAAGLSNKEIARKLTIREGTAKIHLYNIFKKLRVTNRVALANLKTYYLNKESAV